MARNGLVFANESSTRLSRIPNHNPPDFQVQVFGLTPPGPYHAFGFTYLGLMIFIAALGAALGATGVVWHHAVQREKEDQLLWIGEQYRRAILAYQNNSPGSRKHGPTALADLLKDQRQLATVRYLRTLYRDPITNSKEWGILRGSDGFIVGVYSLSQAVPIKKVGFSRSNESFVNASTYSEWRFIATQPRTGPAGTAGTLVGPAIPPAIPLQ